MHLYFEVTLMYKGRQSLAQDTEKQRVTRELKNESALTSWHKSPHIIHQKFNRDIWDLP